MATMDTYLMPVTGDARGQRFGRAFDTQNLSTSKGQIITSGNNAKGGYTQMVAATTQRARWIVITSPHDQGAVLWAIDIAIGGAGSEQIIVPDLLITASDLNLYSFPCTIKAGSRIAVRGGCVTNLATITLGLNFLN